MQGKSGLSFWRCIDCAVLFLSVYLPRYPRGHYPGKLALGYLATYPLSIPLARSDGVVVRCAALLPRREPPLPFPACPSAHPACLPACQLPQLILFLASTTYARLEGHSLIVSPHPIVPHHIAWRTLIRSRRVLSRRDKVLSLQLVGSPLYTYCYRLGNLSRCPTLRRQSGPDSGRTGRHLSRRCVVAPILVYHELILFPSSLDIVVLSPWTYLQGKYGVIFPSHLALVRAPRRSNLRASLI